MEMSVEQQADRMVRHHRAQIKAKGEKFQVVILACVQETIEELSMEMSRVQKKIDKIRDIFSIFESIRNGDLSTDESKKGLHRLGEARPLSELIIDIAKFQENWRRMDDDCNILSSVVYEIKEIYPEECVVYTDFNHLIPNEDVMNVGDLSEETRIIIKRNMDIGLRTIPGSFPIPSPVKHLDAPGAWDGHYEHCSDEGWNVGDNDSSTTSNSKIFEGDITKESHNLYFELISVPSGGWYWHLKDNNHGRIMSSKMFTKKCNAKRGIKAARRCAQSLNNFEIWNKDGDYPYFILRSSNNHVIGISITYDSKYTNINTIISKIQHMVLQ